MSLSHLNAAGVATHVVVGSSTVNAGSNAPSNGAPLHSFFEYGLTKTNVDLGLVHLSACLPFPEFIPLVGEVVPQLLRNLAALTETTAVTVMWGNPYEVQRPDHHYYVDTAFYQMPHGNWLIFELESGQRVDFQIQYRADVGAQYLEGIGTQDVAPLIARFQQQAMTGAQLHGGPTQSQTGGSHAPPPPYADEQYRHTQARPSTVSAPASQSRAQQGHQRSSTSHFASHMPYPHRHQPASIPVPTDHAAVDLLSLPKASRPTASYAPSGPIRTMRHGHSSGFSQSDMAPQSRQSGQAGDHGFNIPAAYSNGTGRPSGSPHSDGLSKHPSRGQVGTAKPTDLRGGEGKERLQGPIPGQKPLIDYKSDDSDDFQILDSAPVVFQDQGPQDLIGPSCNVRQKPAVLGYVTEPKDVSWGADGYPTYGSDTGFAKPLGTIPSSAKYTTKGLHHQLLAPKDANTHLQAGGDRQKSVARPDSFKTEASPRVKPNATPEEMKPAEHLQKYIGMAKGQPFNVGLAEQKKRVQDQGNDGAPHPSLTSFEEKQSHGEEARRRVQNAGSGNVQGLSVVGALGSQQGKSAKSGDSKRQRGDEFHEGKPFKRQKTPEYSEPQTSTSHSDSSKQIRRSPLLAKSKVARGKSMPARSPGPKPHSNRQHSNEQKQNSSVNGEVKRGGWTKDSSEATEDHRLPIIPGASSNSRKIAASYPSQVISTPLAIGSFDAPDVDSPFIQGSEMNPAIGFVGKQAQRTRPTPTSDVVPPPYHENVDIPAANDQRAEGLEFGDFDPPPGDYSAFGGIEEFVRSMSDEELRETVKQVSSMQESQALVTERSYVVPLALGQSGSSGASPSVQPVSTDGLNAGGVKRTRAEGTEEAEENVGVGDEAEHPSKRYRPDSHEGNRASLSSASKLSDEDRKRHEIRKTIDDHKKATAARDPTAQEYRSALSSNNFDSTNFGDSDIDNAFDDPTLAKQLTSETSNSAASTAHPKPAGTTPSAAALNSTTEADGGIEQPAGEKTPETSFTELLFREYGSDWPSFVEPFEYLNHLPADGGVAGTVPPYGAGPADATSPP